jgi:hypothetical protein
LSSPGRNGLQGFPTNVSQLVGPGGTITTVWLYLLQTLWIRSGTAQGGTSAPTGSGQDFYGPVSAIPSGWLLCNGAEINRIEYAALFSVIGTVWGAGDGSTTFNLPPMENRLSIGANPLVFGSRGGAIPTTGGTIGYGVVNKIIKF